METEKVTYLNGKTWIPIKMASFQKLFAYWLGLQMNNGSTEMPKKGAVTKIFLQENLHTIENVPIFTV